MSENTHSSNQSTYEHDSLHGRNIRAYYNPNVQINNTDGEDIHTVGDIHSGTNVPIATNADDESNGIEKDQTDKSVSREESLKGRETILSDTAPKTEADLDEVKTLQSEASQIQSLSFCLSNAHNQGAYSSYALKDSNRHHKGNMRQQEPDCSGTADISVQMYRYLKHNDLKREIQDLVKRENLCATKHCWDEALRLREMRNKLILLKNKNLYENHDLRIDENTRNSALAVMEARENVNKSRARICDRLLYSDEAKDLWQQWGREDAVLEVSESKAVRDLLLPELEDEWKNLAVGDKNRISQLYGQVMNRSDLQDEHKLAAIIRDANDRQKQYMNYLAT